MMEENNQQAFRKIKRVKINTPNGVRFINYKPVVVDENKKELVCNECPYFRKCETIMNPEKPDDPESTFQEFCSEIGTSKDGEKVDTTLMQCIPEEGTLEENLGDLPDIYQHLIAKKGYVKLENVIDCVCKESCPYWNEEHTECKTSNELCFLQDLIKKSHE